MNLLHHFDYKSHRQVHLEQMIDIITTEQNEKEEHESDCLKFILTRRPLDLLIEFAVTETPPGKIPLLIFITHVELNVF